MKKIKDFSLYFVASEEYSEGKNAKEVAEQAISGGIDILQMREKNKTRGELEKLGRTLLSLCKERDITFIVNDDAYLARDIGACGVHLGQEDIKGYADGEVRGIIGDDGIIGISTHSFNQFENANKKDFDYIAFGPIFSTPTKDYSIGVGDIEKVSEISTKPVIFIGGINLSNVDAILDKGARNIAAIRAIAAAQDIKGAARNLKTKIKARG
ncbi:MAG: thiamine phosphate synthase [Omnitrophica bacterium]|nr:thiamine phosphate synthase [Candidatus Omnitrophota bacterium]